MAKLKRTRQQKKLADLKRKNTSTEKYMYSFDEKRTIASAMSKPVQNTSTTNQPTQIRTEDYAFLVHDLKKTLFVTAAIVVVQLVLHAFLIK